MTAASSSKQPEVDIAGGGGAELRARPASIDIGGAEFCRGRHDSHTRHTRHAAPSAGGRLRTPRPSRRRARRGGARGAPRSAGSRRRRRGRRPTRARRRSMHARRASPTQTRCGCAGSSRSATSAWKRGKSEASPRARAIARRRKSSKHTQQLYACHLAQRRLHRRQRAEVGDVALDQRHRRRPQQAHAARGGAARQAERLDGALVPRREQLDADHAAAQLVARRDAEQRVAAAAAEVAKRGRVAVLKLQQIAERADAVGQQRAVGERAVVQRAAASSDVAATSSSSRESAASRTARAPPRALRLARFGEGGRPRADDVDARNMGLPSSSRVWLRSGWRAGVGRTEAALSGDTGTTHGEPARARQLRCAAASDSRAPSREPASVRCVALHSKVAPRATLTRTRMIATFGAAAGRD